MTHEETVTDETLVRDTDKVSDAKVEGTSVSHTDDAEFDERLRERFEASHQLDEALYSARRDTYQQIAEAKRAGQSDEKLMQIEQAGLRRSAELLSTLKLPEDYDPPMPGIALLATHDIPKWATLYGKSSEQLLGPPYESVGATGPFSTTGKAEANKNTGYFRLECDPEGKGGSFHAYAHFSFNFDLDIPTNPLLAPITLSGQPIVRHGQARLQLMFSGLTERYMVAANNMFAKSSCEIRMTVPAHVTYGSDGVPIYTDALPTYTVRPWNIQGTSVYESTNESTPYKNFSSPWFPVDDESQYHAFIEISVRVEAHAPNGYGSYANAFGLIAGKLSAIRVSQYLTN